MNKIEKPTIIKCFATQDDQSGNPAAVFMNVYNSNDIKQQIANKLNLPVTVFVMESDCDIPTIEFFYPNRNMPLCLHGTLAAAHVLFYKSHFTTMSIRTANGKILRLSSKASNLFEVEVSVEHIAPNPVTLLTGSCLLNIDISEITKDLPFTVASTGSPKLLIPIGTQESLVNLNPDYSAIATWSLTNKVNGVYAYYYDTNTGIFHARGFNPITGHKEDAATGVAAASLSLKLGKDIIIQQGQTLGTPCHINIRFENENSIWVGGKTVLAN